MANTNKQYKIFYAISDIGHLSRMDAKSLIDATEYLYPNKFSQIINDVLSNGRTELGKKIGNKYKSKLAKYSLMYELSYRYSDMQIKGFLNNEDGRKIIESTKEVIEKEDPNIIISLSPLINSIILEALSRIDKKIPTAMILTGNTVKKSLIKSLDKDKPHFDKYIVMSAHVKDTLIKKTSLEADKIALVDYPVKINYELIPDESKQLEIKKHFDLPIDRRIVLFYGRPNGFRDIEKIVGNIIKNERLLKNGYFIIFTRNNQKQYEKLFEIVGDKESFRVIGFSEQLYEYISICDVLISSASPEIIKKGMLMKKPIIITSFADKDEKENIDFVLDKGYGEYEKKPKRIVEEIESLILKTEKLERINEKYQESNLRNGMIEIAKEVLDLMGEYTNFEGNEMDKTARRSGFIRKRNR